MVIMLFLIYVFSAIILGLSKNPKSNFLKSICVSSALGTVVMCFLATISISMGKDISINMSSIPINSEKLRVMIECNSSDVYFDDGFGNAYVLSTKDICIKPFTDDEFRTTSVSKVTERETYSKIQMFLLDFGLFSSTDEDFTEYYELCIPKSKIKCTTYALPIEEATLTPIEEVFG